MGERRAGPPRNPGGGREQAGACSDYSLDEILAEYRQPRVAEPEEQVCRPVPAEDKICGAALRRRNRR